MKWNGKLSIEERELLQQKQALRKEQEQWNMMDDFAKYSKIQRKINAIDEKLKDAKHEKNSLILTIVLKYGPQVLGTICLVLLTLYYRRTPLFQLPDNIDLTPFNYIISYPNEKNYVSFHFWIMSCNVVARLIKL